MWSVIGGVWVVIRVDREDREVRGVGGGDGVVGMWWEVRDGRGRRR